MSYVCLTEIDSIFVSVTNLGSSTLLINQGWPDFFANGPNFIKILFFGLQNIFGMFFLKYDIIDVNLGYFSYINS